ncbi:MAG: magnesium transporter [Sphingobacteriia bacterium]|nr:magnesium transporter [Sphingobacteriia bacterium]
MVSNSEHKDYRGFIYGLTLETHEKIDNLLEENKIEEFYKEIKRLHSADIADYISVTSPEHRNKFIDLTSDDFDPNVLVCIDNNLRHIIIEHIGYEKTANIISSLELDDVIYVLEALDETTQKEIFEYLPKTKVSAIEERLSYPEHSAGRLMQQNMITVMEYWTVSQTLDYLRKNYRDYDRFYEVYVLDLKHKPLGSIDVSKLLCSETHSLISNITDKELVVIKTDTDQEEVSYIFNQYDLSSAPVVNQEGRVVGVISIDDIVEVVAEETEEDMLRLGGVSQSDIHLPFIQAAKKRLPWLFVNLTTAFLSSQVIRHFEGEINKLVALAAVMPMVASMGGNAGTQTITVMIRAIALRDIVSANTSRIIIKEILTCVTSGLFIAFFACLALYFLYHDTELSLVFGMALITNFFTAGLIGSLTPITLNKLKIDPAVASGIFLTALTDSIGFWAFLILAKILIIG